jgi:hypothetical protein
MFRLHANTVRKLASIHEATHGRRPARLKDLELQGLDPEAPDPWKGRYRLDKGVLRCTGNPDISEKLW